MTEKLPAPAPAVSGQTPTAADTLKRVRAFIEYARYVLEPGKAAFPDQFPKQVDADEAMARIDHVLTSLSSAPVASARTVTRYSTAYAQGLMDQRGDVSKINAGTDVYLASEIDEVLAAKDAEISALKSAKNAE